MQRPTVLSVLSTQNFFLKNLYFFPKKPAPKKFRTFSQKKNFSNFQETGGFLYFEKGIFRTLTYLELEAYSEP